ncbi:MAG: hypothetical protein PHU43_06005 [Candidatus Bipolaricaulis sp.]|nr:hypothetical protein [Candidatus Bipolaricaulis sp.]
MKLRAVLLVLPLFLSGCLFSANQPVLGPSGDSALFLADDGTYSLFAEAGTLRILKGNEFISIPAATLSGPGGVLDWALDGTRILYSTLEEGVDFGAYTWLLCRVDVSADAVTDVVLQSDAAIARAAFAADGGILVLRAAEESFGLLERLDPATGVLERVADDVIGFRLGVDRETLTLVVGEKVGSLARAHVVRVAAGTGERLELASFLLNEQTLSAYSLLPHGFLWDVDPSGRFVALSVYDQVLVSPAYEDEVTALYLIDTQEATSLRLTRMGIAPSFSPDGSSLLYLTSSDGALSYAAVREIATGATARVVGSNGAVACSWLGPRALALAFEAGNDRYRLIRVDLETGEATVLAE